MATDDARRRSGGDHRLFVWAAVLFPVLVLAGFARTYYLKGLFHTPALPSTLVHLHGLVMTAWVALFVTQVFLVSTRHVRAHQRLGLFGAGLAVVVVVVGTLTAIKGAAHGGAPQGVPPLVFLVVPLVDLAVFVVLLAAALYYRRRPEYHKRLMVLTALNFLPPAVARIQLGFIQNGGLPVVFGIADGLVVLAVVYDSWKNRRLNRAFALGALLILASVPLRLAIGGSAWWMHFATWLVSLVSA
jgi:hypothetical protein